MQRRASRRAPTSAMPATSSHSASAGVTAGPRLVDVAQQRERRRAADQHRQAEGGRQRPSRAERDSLESRPARRVETSPFVHTPPSARAGRARIQRLSVRTPRSSCAATSGATTQRFTPVPSSRPARWVEPRQDVDPPAERVGAARRGADPEVQRRRGAEPPAQAQQRVVQERGAGRAVVLEARLRAPRHEHQLEREARRVGGHQHRLVVDRDDAVAHPHLLLHEVAEQVAAHRARRVGAEALALAGDRGRDERQRVELRVGVRERGAALAALVDEQVHAGRRRRARASARARPRRSVAICSAVRSASEVTGVGRVDDHLLHAGWRPSR